NVREMAADKDRAVLNGQGRKHDVAGAHGSPRPAASTPAPPSAERSATIEPLDVVIRAHIEAALRATHGRVEGPHGAARLLEINPYTLRARMRKLQIDWQAFRDR
ncbi:MAG: helix-turn-helix domain-containing protein, partial [Vicinamibacterales bacterium]